MTSKSEEEPKKEETKEVAENPSVAAIKNEEVDAEKAMRRNRAGSIRLSQSEAEAEAEAALGKTLAQQSRKYNREQLLKFRPFFTARPEGMQVDLEKILTADKSQKKNPQRSPNNNKRHGNDGNDRYNNNNHHHNNNHKGKKGKKRGHRHDAPMDIEIKPLEKSDNRYQAATIQKMSIDETEKLRRDVMSILNKLTPEKFDVLTQRVLDINIETLEMLEQVVLNVFEKALMEPNFSPTYAEFCVQLAGKLPVFPQELEDGNETTISFKKLVLSKCQEEFECQTSDAQKEKIEGLSDSDRSTELFKLKRRNLATHRFIGELYVRNMVSAPIIRECINILFGDVEKPVDEDVEALCKLLTTVGHVLDDSEEHASFCDECFERLSTVKKNLSSARYRFMIDDVVDLRKEKWVNNRLVVQKKISEIHEEEKELQAQIQYQKDKKAAAENGSPHKGGKNSLHRQSSAPSRFGHGDARKGSRNNSNYGDEKRTHLSRGSSAGNSTTGSGGGDDWETVGSGSTRGASQRGKWQRQGSGRNNNRFDRQNSSSRSSKPHSSDVRRNQNDSKGLKPSLKNKRGGKKGKGAEEEEEEKSLGGFGAFAALDDSEEESESDSDDDDKTSEDESESSEEEEEEEEEDIPEVCCCCFLFVSLSIRLSISLSLSIYLSLSIRLSISLSLSLYPSLYSTSLPSLFHKTHT